MALIYGAIALFILFILWLALQPKQGTKAANAPDDSTHQLPKPQEPPLQQVSSSSGQPRSPDYELPEPAPAQDTDAQIKRLMQQNRKIEAIKLIRETTGCSLKHAKDYIDRFPDLVPLSASALSGSYHQPKSMDHQDVNGRVQQLMQQNRKVEAIKLVRAVTGWGLRESKDYVEQFPDLTPLPDASKADERSDQFS